MGSLPDIDEEIGCLEKRLAELKEMKADVDQITGTNPQVKCKVCRDKGYTEYYHDAGDHFGAGQAPGSGYRRTQCICQKEGGKHV